MRRLDDSDRHTSRYLRQVRSSIIGKPILGFPKQPRMETERVLRTSTDEIAVERVISDTDAGGGPAQGDIVRPIKVGLRETGGHKGQQSRTDKVAKPRTNKFNITIGASENCYN